MAEVKAAAAPAKRPKSALRLPPRQGPWDLRPKEPVGYVISYWFYCAGAPHDSNFTVKDTIYESLEDAKKVALADALEHRNNEEELRAEDEKKDKGLDYKINEDEDDYDADKKAEMESKELLADEPHITIKPQNHFMVIDVSSSLPGGESLVVVRRQPYYWLNQLWKAVIGYDHDPERLLIEVHAIEKMEKKSPQSGARR